jgi:hypothetical protein
MPHQLKRTSFTPHVSKGGAEKRRVQATPAARFRPTNTTSLKRISQEEIRQNLGLA